MKVRIMTQGENPDAPEGKPERKHVSARVPESVAKGVFSSGVVVMASAHELVLDFMQTLVQPNQLVSRVILPWATVPNLVGALRQNLENHEKRFGGREPEQESERSVESKPQKSKDPDSEPDGGEKVLAGRATKLKSSESQSMTRRVEAAGFYDELRIEDDILIGVYANGAMINHTEFEFKLDFLSTLHPHPIVVARVFMSEPQIRRLLTSLEENEAQRRGAG